MHAHFYLLVHTDIHPPLVYICIRRRR